MTTLLTTSNRAPAMRNESTHEVSSRKPRRRTERPAGEPMNVDDGRYIQFSDDQLARMDELYISGASTRKISAIYGIADSSVRRRLRMRGIAVRKRGQQPLISDEEAATVAALRAKGVRWGDISRMLGRSISSLREALIRHNKQMQIGSITA